MDPFISGVAKTIDRYGLLPDGSGVVVAISGGPDSTALLAALAALAPERGLRLVAAHLDHGLRPDAPDDARFAEAQARALGVRFVTERCDVARLARQWGTSIEAAGRKARYRFLRRAAAEHGCRRIAVGHHRDDQVETVLLNLLAGAGTDGIAGMRPRRGDVVRPLFERRREEVLAFLKRQGLAYRTDPSNADPAFARNRVRWELLPLLRQRFNRRIDDALWRMARLVADEVDYLEERAAELLQAARLPLPGGLWLQAGALKEAPPALRRRIIRQAYWEAAGEDLDTRAALALRHVEAVEGLLTASGGALDLPGGVRVSHEQGRLCWQRLDGAGGGDGAAGPGAAGAGSIAAPQELPVPGAVAWDPPWAGIHAEVLSTGELGAGDLGRPGHAFLDYDRLGAPTALMVRTWRPGDRMRPLGAPGSRKLQDVFVDRKLPRSLRRRVPVVTLGDAVVWVPGVALAHAYRVTGETRRILHLYVTGAETEVLR